MQKLFWVLIIGAVIAALSVILLLNDYLPTFILPFAFALLALYIIRIDRLCYWYIFLTSYTD